MRHSLTFYRTAVGTVDWLESRIYPKGWTSNGFTVLDIRKININELLDLIEGLGKLSVDNKYALMSRIFSAMVSRVDNRD